MQLRIQNIFSSPSITVSFLLGSLFVAGCLFAAQANAQQEKAKEKAKEKAPAPATLQKDKPAMPSPPKKDGDAGTQTDAGNKPEQAITVKLNETYKGFLSLTSDTEDLYKIQVKKDAPLTINVNNDVASTGTLYVTILYANGKPLEEDYDATADPDPGEAEQIIIDKAPAATLLLKARTQRGNLTYTFKLSGKLE